MIETRVVFPQPLGPTSMSNSPWGTSRSTPRSARATASPEPKSRATPRTWTAGDGGEAGGGIGREKRREWEIDQPRKTIAGSTMNTRRIDRRLARSTIRKTATPVITSTCQGM